MVGGQIQNILEYFNFCGPLKFGVLKPRKHGYFIESFISQKVNILKHSYLVSWKLISWHKFLILNKLWVILGGWYCHSPNWTATELKSWVWHENDFTPPTTTSMPAIYHLFLTQILPNFKGRFLGSTTRTWTTITITTPSMTKKQQYVTDYWLDFDQTLKLGFCDQQ